MWHSMWLTVYQAHCVWAPGLRLHNDNVIQYVTQCVSGPLCLSPRLRFTQWECDNWYIMWHSMYQAHYVWAPALVLGLHNENVAQCVSDPLITYLCHSVRVLVRVRVTQWVEWDWDMVGLILTGCPFCFMNLKLSIP